MIKPENQVQLSQTLFLDIGNSKAKLVGYSDSWQFLSELPKTEYARLSDWLATFSSAYSTLIWTSVVSGLHLNLQTSDFETVIHITRESIPLSQLDYATPKTLGLDRYFACLGAYSQANEPVIVIDSGTALTVDLMDKSGVFKGGTISPGLHLWERSLLEYAPALPPVQRSIPPIWPPKSTDEALRWGISGGFVFLVQSLINEWKKRYPKASVWCTGGDGKWVSSYVGKSEFDAFLVEKGMFITAFEKNKN